MKINCPKEVLKNAVQVVEKVSGKNLSLPVLNNILIEVEISGEVLIKATNLEMGVIYAIKTNTDGVGRVALNGKVLLNLLQNIFPDGNLTLETKNENILISDKKTKSLIKCQIADDFPLIPIIEHQKNNKNNFILADLVSGLRSVSYASSFSDIKQEIASVLFANHDRECVFAATDSFRLAEKTIVKTGDDNSVFIIPIKNTNEIIRTFEGKEGVVEVSYDKHQVSFSSNGIYLVSRVIDGVFPDYQQIMPKDFSAEVVADREELGNALKLSGVFSDKFNQTKIKINPDKESLELITTSDEKGESQIIVNAAVKGKPAELNFNGRFILDAFSSINSSQIFLGFAGDKKPLLIRGINDQSFRYLVMPLYT